MAAIRRHVYIANGARAVWRALTTAEGLEKWLAEEARAILNSAPGANLSRLLQLMLSRTNSFFFLIFAKKLMFYFWNHQGGPLLSNVHPCGALGELAFEPSCGGRALS